eukprot:9381051-Karenia_brevis.AAC.1
MAQFPDDHFIITWVRSTPDRPCKGPHHGHVDFISRYRADLASTERHFIIMWVLSTPQRTALFI